MVSGVDFATRRPFTPFDESRGTMSMSTPGPDRVPSTVKVGKTSGQGKPPAGGSSGSSRPGSGKKPGAGKGKGRKPVTPVKVSGGRSWGPIAVIGAVVLIAGGIIGYGVYATVSAPEPETWETRAAAIDGVVDYRSGEDQTIVSRNHVEGPQTYKVLPPVGGDHNSVWQSCQGNVYDAAVANEHAVHSLEHGAVWITYRPGISADQISSLAGKVEGRDYMLMSPYDGMDSNISLQAWGYQLKVDNASDPRIDEFISTMRVQASVEPGATCASNQTSTGPLAA